jgi:hypothetical protein
LTRITPRADLELAARRAGARWVSAGEATQPIPKDGAVFCSDGWHAALLLQHLSAIDSERAWVKTFAEWLRKRAGSDLDVARTLLLIGQSIPFFQEKGEIFQGPHTTFKQGGDCDDHDRMLFAIGRAAGLPVRHAFFFGRDENRRPKNPTHVATVANVPRLVFLDSTVRNKDATDFLRFGEHPLAGARRLGVARADLMVPEVVIMGDVSNASWAVSPGIVRARVQVNTPADLLEDPVSSVSSAFQILGFQDISVWTTREELPADWPADDAGATSSLIGPWTAWVSGSWAKEAAEVPSSMSGFVSLEVKQAWQASTSTAEPSSDVCSATGTMGSLDDAAAGDDKPAGTFKPQFLTNLDGRFPWTLLEAADELAQVAGVPVQAADLAAIFLSESTLNPKAINADRCVGLNQFCPGTLEGYFRAAGVPRAPHALSPDEHAFNAHAYVLLSGSEQLKYITAFFAGHVRRHGPDSVASARNLYWLNFLPETFVPDAPDSYELPHTRKDNDTYGWYRENAGAFDRDHKGYFTAGDLRKWVDYNKNAHPRSWNEIVAALTVAQSTRPPSDGAGVLVAALGVVAVVGAGALALANSLA